MSLVARAMTSPELALVRTPGQFSKLYLAIAKYNTIYTAQLATVPSSTDNVSQIAYNTGSGTLADVKAGMTLYVGSSAGAHDLGMCRIRKAPDATYFYIGALSKIDWSAASPIYLTVKDDFALRMKPMLWSASMKMDYEYAYSNQHSSFDPVPVLGPHAVLWLTGASVSIQFDGSNSWVIGSTISGHSWTAPGASGASGLTTATPTFTYNAPGFYRVYDTVTAANGKTFVGVRHVFVYSAASMPVTKFQIKENPRCDASSGGWSFGVTMYDEAALADVREGALVILFAEDWYGETKQSLGPVTNRENIIAMGWIAGETIQWDANGGSVDFQVLGPAGWLKQMPIYPYDMQFKIDAVRWNEMPGLNVQRALFHLLHWRTTITAIMDVKITSDARMSPNFQAANGAVWEQIDEIAKKIFARPGCDRYGRLFVEVDPQMTPEVSRTWATVMTVTNADRLNGLALRKVKTMKPVSMLPTSGWQTNSSGKAVTLYSLAMGHIPLDFGGMESPIDKLLVEDQTQGNEMAGLALGWKNNEWPDVPISMPHNNRFVDCWPNQFIAATLDAGDSPREEEYSGNLIPRVVELAWDPASNSFSLNATCEAETFPTLAIDGDPPAASLSIDSPPPLPPVLPPPGTTETTPEGPSNCLIPTWNFGFLYTLNLNESTPQWFTMNGNLSEKQYKNTGSLPPIKYVARDPLSGYLYILTLDYDDLAYASDSRGATHLFCAPGLGGIWTELLYAGDIAGVTDPQTEKPRITTLIINPNNGQILVTGGKIGDMRVYTGNYSGVSIVSTSPLDMRRNIGGGVYLGAKWLIMHAEDNTFSSRAWSRLLEDGTVEINTSNDFGALGSDADARHHAIQLGDKVLYWTSGNDLVWIPNQNPPNMTFATGLITGDAASEVRQCLIAADPTGQFLIGGGATTIGKRSSDYGSSWGNIGTAGGMSTGYRVWGNCGDGMQFVGTTSQKVMLTLDWGSNWIDKTGDLSALAPLCSPNHILAWY